MIWWWGNFYFLFFFSSRLRNLLLSLPNFYLHNNIKREGDGDGDDYDWPTDWLLTDAVMMMVRYAADTDWSGRFGAEDDDDGDV